MNIYLKQNIWKPGTKQCLMGVSEITIRLDMGNKRTVIGLLSIGRLAMKAMSKDLI